MLSAIVGINWGDEGKGRMVDLLGSRYDIVVRYQGGNNAGHTVVNEKGKFILNLLPSGILRDNTVNVMGNGMVIDLQHLGEEMGRLTGAGIKITPDNLKISDRAIICFPFHKRLDILEEERLGDKKYGSTMRGIAPVYSDKYMKKGIRVGDLLSPATLREKIAALLEWKNLTITGAYKSEPTGVEETLEWLERWGKPILPFVCDTGSYLYGAAKTGRDILFEAQLGALRDIDFGIYPYTSSSNNIAAYAPIGAGVPGLKIDNVIGIMKAYSTCVGGGPFTAEMFGPEAEELRKAGGEYGAATGRPRRVGGFDVPASKYGVKVQGADVLALTKLDVLSYMDEIPVCVAYNIGGEITDEFPTGDRLTAAKPVYKYFKGFGADVSGCRRLSDLPTAAREYVEYIERAVECPLKYISVGAERDAIIEL
jgi:adenylosuccinate synthase